MRLNNSVSDAFRTLNNAVDRLRKARRKLIHRNSRKRRIWLGCVVLIIAGVLGYDCRGWSRAQGTASMYVGAAMVDANGVAYYPVRSAYQGYREEFIRVLRPSHPRPGIEPSTLYVLPVDIGVDTLLSKWSDGLEQLRLLDAANRFNMTLIAPSFWYIPWYGDNDHGRRRRMESFIVLDLVPFADRVSPSGHVRRRYLVGFSKSGNGALVLILKHPDIFQAAAAWDCPAELHSLSAFSELGTNFADQANLNVYNIPVLIQAHAEAFRHQNKLWISGDKSIFTPDMIKLHDQLTALSIRHTWVEGGYRHHDWGSGWLEGAVEGLAAGSATLPTRVAGNGGSTRD